MSRGLDERKSALDRIKVRRPFDPSLFEAAPAIELPPPEEEPASQEAAVQKEERRPAQEEAPVVQEEVPVVQEEVSEVHPEYEEKPVAEGGQQTSEDYHGGTELTFSMPTQRQSGQQGAQQQGGQASGESAEGEPSEAKEEAGGEAAQEAGEPQEGAKGKGQEEEHEEPAEGASDEGEQEGQQDGEQNGGGKVRGSGGAAAEEEEQAEAGERAAHREVEEHAEGGEEEHEGGGEGGGKESGEEGEAEEESGGEGEEEDGEEEEEEEESGSQSTSGGYNSAQVVGLEGEVEGEGLSPEELRRLQTEFYRLIEMIAEEKTKYFDPSLAGSLAKAEYNVKRMALRRFEGKPPTYYKMPRVRESVVLILDNSGSMVPYANMLRALADIAAKRRDVEIYIAPNGHVEEELAPVERPVDHDKFMKRTAGRKVIYVGDFDGANTPIELSWRNDVIWIAPEDRYRRFLSHNWVRYGEDRFKGTFVRAFSIDDILAGIKKALSGAKWIDMCGVCEDEEDAYEDEEDQR
jgi:hypothetical protein